MAQQTQSIADRDAQETGHTTTAGTDALATRRLRSAGIDILSGPTRGKRLFFTGRRTLLGIGKEVAVIIRADGPTYTAEKQGSGITVSINDDRIEDDVVGLNDGDHIDAAGVRIRFFLEPDPRPRE